MSIKGTVKLENISKEALLEIIKKCFHALDALGTSVGDTLQGYNKDEYDQLDTEVSQGCIIDDAMKDIASGLKEVIIVEYRPVFSEEDRRYVDDLDFNDDEDEDEDNEDDKEDANIPV